MKQISTTCIAALFCFTSHISHAGDPSKSGDVVARDLDAGWASPLGHVGLYAGFGQILEVMNASPVIQTNTLANFKKATTYWGARYHSAPPKTAFGYSQTKFSPVYTTTAQWREGKLDLQCVRWSKSTCTSTRWVTITARFRCDTFVNYIFLKTNGYNLVTLFTPRNVYNSFSYSR